MVEEKKDQIVPKEKQLIVKTDGKQWNIAKETDCNPLEIKEICRELLLRLGG